MSPDDWVRVLTALSVAEADARRRAHTQAATPISRKQYLTSAAQYKSTRLKLASVIMKKGASNPDSRGK